MSYECIICDGKGCVYEHQPLGPYTCHDCKGTGVAQPHGEYQCSECLGKGYQQNPCTNAKKNSKLYNNVISEMKNEINNLVWKYIPGTTTIEEAKNSL